MKFNRLLSNIALILALLLTCINAYAKAPQCTSERLKQPMRASLHAFDGKTILLLAGGIESETGDAMQPWIARKNSYSEVWLCSGGGSVASGIKIGEYLNRVQATVRTPNGYFCASACTIASMGGYVRIIDPQADFVTHASSSASGFGIKGVTDQGISYSSFIVYGYCKKSEYREECAKMRAFLKQVDPEEKYRCKKYDDFTNPAIKCMYFDLQTSHYENDLFISNAWFTMLLVHDPERFLEVIRFRMRSRVESEVQLVNYFHRMLIDGNTRLLNNNSYSVLRNEFLPTSIYQLDSSDPYFRDFQKDSKALQSASESIADWYAVWQAILTDVELSLKAQLTDFVRARSLNLGAGNTAVLKLYDSMRTCQIQSSCKLEPHTAFSLGYQNIVESD